MAAVDAVQRWLACFERGDFAGARAALAPDAPTIVLASGENVVELRGFDELLAWYSDRRALFGESFEYDVEELAAGERHVVALITLSRTDDGGTVNWRQVAVYTVDDDVITAIRLYEEPQTRSGRW